MMSTHARLFTSVIMEANNGSYYLGLNEYLLAGYLVESVYQRFAGFATDSKSGRSLGLWKKEKNIKGLTIQRLYWLS